MKSNSIILIGINMKKNKDYGDAMESLGYLLAGWKEHFSKGKNKITYRIETQEVDKQKEKSKIIV